MYHEENRSEEEQGRNNSRPHDIQIRPADDLRHDEGSRSHDRRSDLASGGGYRLDGPRLIVLVSVPLHDGDRESPAHRHIARCRAGDQSDEGAEDHGGLGGGSLQVAGKGVRQVVQEVAHLEFAQEGPVDGKQDDIGSRDPHGDPVNALS